MVNYYEITDKISDIILSSFYLDIPYLTKNFTKNALGQQTQGVILPFEGSFKGTFCTQYLNTLSLEGLSGVVTWIDFLHVMQKRGMNVIELTYEFVEAYAIMAGLNYSTWLVPCIKVAGNGQDRQVSTIYVSVCEYMARHDLKDFYDFAKDMLEIILYGVPMRPGCVDVLEMDQPGAYVTSRLFQGVAEVLVDDDALRLPYFLSHFVDSALLNIAENEFARAMDTRVMEQKLKDYQETQEGMKRLKLQMDIESNAAQILTSTHWYLGSNSDDMIQMSHKFAFTGLTGDYANYLKRNKVGQTMGYSLWESVVMARGSEQNDKEAVGDQIPDLWWNKIISTSVGV